MQSSKEYQEEIRKPSSRINAKKKREKNKTEKNRDLLEKISYTQGNISCKDGHNKGQKWYGPNRRRRY